MEVSEAHGGIMKGVDIRCLQPWIARAAEVAITLVVRYY